MKYILRIIIICSSLVWEYSYSQSEMPKMDSVKTDFRRTFFASSSQDSVFLFLGDKALFKQSCTNLLPESLSDHSIGFNEILIRDMAYQSVFYFKDTALYKAIYYYEGKDKDSALELFGLSKDDFVKQKKFTYFYTSKRGNIQIKCWFSKTQLFYEEKLISLDKS